MSSPKNLEVEEGGAQPNGRNIGGEGGQNVNTISQCKSRVQINVGVWPRHKPGLGIQLLCTYWMRAVVNTNCYSYFNSTNLPINCRILVIKEQYPS